MQWRNGEISGTQLCQPIFFALPRIKDSDNIRTLVNRRREVKQTEVRFTMIQCLTPARDTMCLEVQLERIHIQKETYQVLNNERLTSRTT